MEPFLLRQADEPFTKFQFFFLRREFFFVQILFFDIVLVLSLGKKKFATRHRRAPNHAQTNKYAFKYTHEKENEKNNTKNHF